MLLIFTKFLLFEKMLVRKPWCSARRCKKEMYREELTHRERQIASYLEHYITIFASLENDESFRELSFKVKRVYKIYISTTDIKESLKDTEGKNMFLICPVILLMC